MKTDDLLHPPLFDTPAWQDLRDRLRAEAVRLDRQGEWPADQLRRLGAFPTLGALIPAEYGGAALGELGLLPYYWEIGRHCLTTAFILTQRNAAVARIVNSPNEPLRRKWLRRLATADAFGTVGISHLTTSRQHTGTPAVRAVEADGGYRLDGTVPWVTGGAHADVIVSGGQLPDGRQFLAAVERGTPGVTVEAPERLLALQGSSTGPITFDGVFVPADGLLAPPVEGVLKTGASGGAGSYTTSLLALAAARGTLDAFAAEAEKRTDLGPILSGFETELGEATDGLVAAITPGAIGAPTAEVVRLQANSLVTRVAQAYLAASKGAGFVKGHPAERYIRESMFFYVWSCPQAVLLGNLRELGCREEGFA